MMCSTEQVHADGKPFHNRSGRTEPSTLENKTNTDQAEEWLARELGIAERDIAVWMANLGHSPVTIDITTQRWDWKLGRARGVRRVETISNFIHNHYRLLNKIYTPLPSLPQPTPIHLFGNPNNANNPPATGLATNVGPSPGNPPVLASNRSVMARCAVVSPIQRASLPTNMSRVSGLATAAANMAQSDLAHECRVSSGTA